MRAEAAIFVVDVKDSDNQWCMLILGRWVLLIVKGNLGGLRRKEA